MLNCKGKKKSIFECSGNSSTPSKNGSDGFYNLNVEVYLEDSMGYGGNYTDTYTQIFKGIAGVRFKKKYNVTNYEYQGVEVSVRVPSVKIRAGCDIGKDLTSLRFKYLNSHTKKLDIVSVNNYEPDGWGSTMILSGTLNYSENT